MLGGRGVVFSCSCDCYDPSMTISGVHDWWLEVEKFESDGAGSNNWNCCWYVYVAPKFSFGYCGNTSNVV